MQADRFNLYIRLGNAEMQTAADVALALRRIADRLEDAGELPTHFLTIFDTNGNVVGRYAAKGNPS